MDRKFPITKERLRNAWTYSRWAIVLLVVLSLAGWNLFYQMTAYRVPDDKKVEFYVDQYGGMDTSASDGLMESIRQAVLPELEELTCIYMALDDQYGSTKLIAWVSAGEGDVFLLTEPYFQQMALSGALTPLQPLIDAGALDVGEIDMTAGYVADEETGANVLYGIPADGLKGLESYGIAAEERFLCIVQQEEVEEAHSVTFVSYLLQNLREPVAPPTEATAE